MSRHRRHYYQPQTVVRVVKNITYLERTNQPLWQADTSVDRKDSLRDQQVVLKIGGRAVVLPQEALEHLLAQITRDLTANVAVLVLQEDLDVWPLVPITKNPCVRERDGTNSK